MSRLISSWRDATPTPATTRFLPSLLSALVLAVFPPHATAQTFTDITLAPLNATGNGDGAAWGDYDNDGRVDLFLTNFAGAASKLFHNDGAGVFVRVTSVPYDSAGARCAVWGDYDNDGDLDLYLVKQNQPNRLFRNNGAGSSFTDVTVAPLDDAGAGRSAAWVDYDNDGDLDLYVAKENNQANKLFRNDGGGAFSNVTGSPVNLSSTGEGVAWGDYDNDGDQDLYVANNAGQPNKLFRNDGAGTFTDVNAGPLNDAGNGIGAAWGDYDNDGDLDLFVTNDSGAGDDKLFRNDGGGVFADASSGLPTDSGNGRTVAWVDYDNDGDLDVYLTNNGASNKLFRNDGGGVFADVTSGTPLAFAGNSLGAAWADFDNDGDVDLYLASTGTTGRLVRNDQPVGSHWLELKLKGRLSNHSAIGARVEVLAGGVRRIQEVSGGSGYFSQNSLPLEFGLGAATVIDSVVVRWPSGIVQALTPPSVDGIVTVDEPVGGVDISMVACPGNGTAQHGIVLDCAGHGTAKFYLVFQPAEAIPDLVAFDATLSITRATGIPPFWNFDPSGCNPTGLNVSHVRPVTICNAYTAAWSPSGSGDGMTTIVVSPTELDVVVQCFRAGAPLSVAANQKIFGAEFTLDLTTATQSGGACSGCDAPICIRVKNLHPLSNSLQTTELTGRASYLNVIYPNGTAATCDPVLGVDGSPVARVLQLESPWPNPAAGRTRLRFELPGESYVTADVFDAAGRHVSSPMRHRLLSGGAHEVTWDGLDVAGSRVSPGIYEVRVSIGDAAAIRRVVMLQ